MGEIYLQVLGMTPEEAASYASSVDWTSTFVIPVPRYRAEYQEVQVDGVTGTLIRHRDNGQAGLPAGVGKGWRGLRPGRPRQGRRCFGNCRLAEVDKATHIGYNLYRLDSLSACTGFY